MIYTMFFKYNITSYYLIYHDLSSDHIYIYTYLYIYTYCMKHFIACMLIIFCIHMCTLKLHTYGMHFATQRRFYLFHYVYLLISSYTHLLSQITFWTVSDERISMIYWVVALGDLLVKHGSIGNRLPTALQTPQWLTNGTTWAHPPSVVNWNELRLQLESNHNHLPFLLLELL